MSQLGHNLMITNLDTLISRDANIRNGRPCIAGTGITGTGITVHRVAIWYRLGHSAEDIARQYPHLALDGVYAALAYYHANRSEIDAEIEADEAIAQQLEAQHTAKQPIAS
jgi:uncharacterized protein (DUF433 family)